MDSILTIVRWAIVLPIFLIEVALKSLAAILVFVMMIVCAIFFPIVKNLNSSSFIEKLFFYSLKWRGKGYVLTRKVYKLWTL